VIVTSYLFPDGKFALDRLEGLEKKVGREKLIVDISCRRREDGWVVAMNGWKTLTDMWVTKGMSTSSRLLASDTLTSTQCSPNFTITSPGTKANDIESIALIEKYCSELLIHAADVEGLCQGVDEELVKKLGEWVSLPCTYAGGARG